MRFDWKKICLSVKQNKTITILLLIGLNALIYMYLYFFSSLQIFYLYFSPWRETVFVPCFT